MFVEMPNRDAGTDLVRIATYLARKPFVKRPWDKEPPSRDTHRLMIGAGWAEKLGLYLNIDGGDAFFIRGALPWSLPVPMVVVRWDAERTKDFAESFNDRDRAPRPAAPEPSRAGVFLDTLRFLFWLPPDGR